MNHLRPNTEFIWRCPLTKARKKSAHSTCAKEFAKQNDFQLIETSDDGNCFFYTLTKFGKRANFEPFMLSRNEHENSLMLRQQVIDYIESNIHIYEGFLYNNNNLGTVNEQVAELREDGAWASEAGDLVPIAGANTFNVNINMYNILDRDSYDEVRLVQILSQEPSNIYVSIMRVRQGHFQLLWPRSGVFRSKGFNNVEDKKESICDQTAMTAALIATKAAQVVIDYAEKISSKNNNAELASSLLRNKNEIKNMMNQLEESALSIKNISQSRHRNNVNNNMNNNVNNIVNNFSNLSLKQKNVSKRRLTRSTVNKLSKVENSIQPRRSTRLSVKKSLTSQNQNKKRNTQNNLNNSYVRSMNKPKRGTRSTRKKKINNNNNAANLARAIKASEQNIGQQNNNLNNNMRTALKESEQNY
jgi:hypothetical protein